MTRIVSKFSGLKRGMGAYDNMGRLIGTITEYAFLPGITCSNAYGYDADSNRTSFTAPGGSTNTYAYDTLDADS